MSIPFIDLKSQYKALQPQIQERINRMLEHGQYIMGPEVKELEDKLQAYTGAKHCITVASGTEALLISLISTKQYAANRDGFRRLTWQEGRRYFKRWFVQAAQAIVPRIKPEHLQPTTKVGIRAQMFNTQKGKLENDFLIEQGENSTHILNAISPACTSAFPFARHVCGYHIP